MISLDNMNVSFLRSYLKKKKDSLAILSFAINHKCKSSLLEKIQYIPLPKSSKWDLACVREDMLSFLFFITRIIVADLFNQSFIS